MKKIKLNLGSGNDYKDGWVNVDADKNIRKDIYVDLSKKFPFKENYADEILASDILEHFTKEDGEKFLEECWRVLKINGKITIRTHNIYKIFEQFKDDPYVLTHFLYGDTSETGIFGSHKFAYTKKELQKLLNKIGFTDISIEEETTNWLLTANKVNKKQFLKLKIAIIQQSPDFGGAEEFMLNLIKIFSINKHHIFLATNEGKFFNYCKKEINELKKLPFFLDITGNYKGLIKSIILFPYGFVFYCKLLYFYKKNNVDIILMSGFSEKSIVSLLSLFFKVPVVWIEYGPLNTILSRNFYLPKILYRLLKRIPKKIIVPSKNTKQSLIVETKVSLSKLELVPCGVELNSKTSLDKRSKSRIVVGNVSRVTKEKGQDFLIDSMPLVLNKASKAEFLFVGDGPDLEYFKNKVKKLGIEKQVKFTGFVEDIDYYFSQMDIFVFPSAWEFEGFGLVAVEAMSRRIPVIGNNYGPIKEVLGQGAGLLVDVKDPDELSSTIIQLINDKKLRNKIAEAGLKKANKEYDIKKIAKLYERIFYDAVYFDE